MDHGLKRLGEGFPLSLRLIREIHKVLLRKGRGSDRSSGEFRRTQNWVGGTRPGNAIFIPPPPEKVIECMGTLEKFLHDRPVKTPILIKAALAHVQFESIHPFLDENGRLGRLLITFLLCAQGSLNCPMLYLSLFLRKIEAGIMIFFKRSGRRVTGKPGFDSLSQALKKLLNRPLRPPKTF